MPALSVNPLIPRGRGGGGGGGSHGSSSNGGGGSSSGSTYNGYGSETGSSSGSSGSGYSSSSYKGSGSGSKSTSSTLAIWALVLLITLACIGLIFKISLIYYYRQERKKNQGNIRHAHVIGKALKIAFFLWIPIGLFKLCTGRKKRTSNGAATNSTAYGVYTKIDQGQQTIGNSNTPWQTTPQPVLPPTYPYVGGAGYVPIPAPAPTISQPLQHDTAPPYDYSYRTGFQAAAGGGGEGKAGAGAGVGGGGSAQEYYSGQIIMPVSMGAQTSAQPVYQAPPVVQIHNPYPMNVAPYAPGR